MRLYLVQHGKAKSKDEDPDRPLSDEGHGDVRRVGARLAGAVEVSRIVHSGKTRARETAEELARTLGRKDTEPPVEKGDNLGPTDDTSIQADRLESSGADGVMLVGHLPYMERMAARLVAGNQTRSAVTFSKGGVLCLGRDGPDDDDGWTVRWFVTPEVA